LLRYVTTFFIFTPMNKTLFNLFILFITFGLTAQNQDNSFYDTDLLPSSFHQNRRQALRDSLPANSVAVLFSFPVRNRSNDVDYEFHQNPDFYYLTGYNEPDAILLVFKNNVIIDSDTLNEIIFVQPNDPKYEIWNGKRLGIAGVKEKLGFKNVRVNKEFADYPINFSQFDKILFILPKEDFADNKKEKGDLASLIKHFNLKTDTLNSRKEKFLLYTYMAALREVKLPEEISLMRKAINITCEAQIELMKALNPGMKEYQAESIIEFVFAKNGAEAPGFPSILGGGENSCILHYTSNRKTLLFDDMLVCDIGAEYHGYSADVTRTIPVDGEFSEEEAIIYSIVLEAQEAGIKVCKPGNRFWDPNTEAKKIIQQRLLENGIIKEPAETTKYFMHGTSHYLGLDVHDAGLYGNLKPGNVITVEPGIYIPKGSNCDPKWWNIGVRIEDDVLITEKGHEVLSSCVPKTIKEIEALMKQESILNKLIENK
jgi:Xaa-Pro aminopeptidase